MNRLLGSMLLVLYFAQGIFAQDAAAPAKLRVLAKPAPPFVIELGDGHYRGYSIELWKRIAAEAKLDFEFQPVKTVPEAVSKLTGGEADVAVGAFSITAEREAVLDFSHPIYEAGLKILAPRNAEISVASLVRRFLQRDILTIIGFIVLALIINSHVLWFFERKRNPDSFPKEYLAGIFEATWWNMSTLLSMGCENLAPKGVIGRISACVWMGAAAAVLSLVTATFSSIMTVNNLHSTIRGLSDLQRMPPGTVGTIGGSTTERYLTSPTIRISPKTDYKSVDELCDALAARDSQLGAVVYDEPLLAYYLANHPGGNLGLVGDIFEKANYGFVLQQKSPYRKAINRALLKVAEEGFLDDLRKKYFSQPQR